MLLVARCWAGARRRRCRAAPAVAGAVACICRPPSHRACRPPSHRAPVLAMARWPAAARCSGICASLIWWYARAGAGVPTACSTIEEVGSTGVGALTVGFIIFAVCTVVFLAKANTSGEQRKCVTLSCTPAHQWGSQESRHSEAAMQRTRAVHEGSCWKTIHRICAKHSHASQLSATGVHALA